MSSYLLRVQLSDRPGSLGALAVALGSAEADILSLDVVDRSDGYAIDDLVVQLPSGTMPDVLITAAEALSGVRVESVRPYTGLLDVHRELELIGDIASAATRHDKLQILADEAPRAMTARWCIVGRPDKAPDKAPDKTPDKAPQAGRFRRLAASVGAPESNPDSASWLSIDAASALDGTAEWVPSFWRDVDTALAAAPLGDDGTVVLLGRTGGPAFRPAEITRLDHLARIAAKLLGVSGRDRSPA